MKYIAVTLPMFFGVEVLSILCLVLMAIMFLCDIGKSAERR